MTIFIFLAIIKFLSPRKLFKYKMYKNVQFLKRSKKRKKEKTLKEIIKNNKNRRDGMSFNWRQSSNILLFIASSRS